MVKFRTLRIITVMAALVLVIAACGDDDAATTTAAGGGETTMDDPMADWPDVLTLAAVPAETTEDLGVSWGPFAEALSDELGGIEVETFAATDYGAVIEAMIAEEIDLAFFGAFAYYLAKNQVDYIEPIGINVIRESGMIGYHSYGITQPDNDEVNSLADFRGRTTCFVDPGSTSGYLFPTAGLLGEGIDPDADVEPVFAGSHDGSLLSVISGDCEVGFFHEFTLIDIDEDRFDLATRDDFKIVWESPLIPAPAMVINTNLPESFVDAVAEAIVKIDAWYLAENGYCDDTYEDYVETESGPACLIRDTFGYDAADDSFFIGVDEVCERTGAEACTKE